MSHHATAGQLLYPASGHQKETSCLNRIITILIKKIIIKTGKCLKKLNKKKVHQNFHICKETIPGPSLQHHGDRTHQVCYSPNSNSSGEELPHMDQCLLPRTASSPACLSCCQKTSTRNLYEIKVTNVSCPMPNDYWASYISYSMHETVDQLILPKPMERLKNV